MNDDETARVNKGRRVSSKSPSLVEAVEEVIRKQGNGQDLIQVMLLKVGDSL